MFGNPVTDGAQVLIGGVGYVVAFDLSNQNIDKIKAVQLYKSDVPISVGEHTEEASSRNDLFMYTSNTAAPDVAFYQEGTIVYVFVKDSVFPYVAENRIAFWFTTHASASLNTNSRISVPSSARSLLKAYVKLAIYEDEGGRIPAEIEEDVRKQKAALGL
jgi:hypothetical protein